MRKRLISIFFLSATVCSSAFSTNLWHVYQQALTNDQTFAQARASWLSAKTTLLTAQSTVLFPTILLTGGYNHNKVNAYNTPAVAFATARGWNWAYDLKVTEPIFNFAGWSAMSEANDSIKAATATYLAAAQTLISTTISKYITVLEDYNNIRYIQASKNAFYRQMETAEQQYKVGLKPKTAVYDAKAQYDAQVAAKIAAQTTLRNDLETLAVITSYHYTSLNGIRSQIPLAKPQPTSMQAWVRTALNQNYDYLAARYLTLAKKKDIQVQALALAPVFSLSGEYSGNNNAPAPPAPFNPAPHVSNTSYGLALSFSPFQGGAVIAATQKARHDYEGQADATLLAYRNTISNTRQSYLGVLSGISQIRADLETVRSKGKSLEATKQGYTVGTNTITEVLTNISEYYQAKQTYSDDQYNYLNTLVSLKLAAGTLSYRDVMSINRILKQPISLNRILDSHQRIKTSKTPALHRAPKLKPQPRPSKSSNNKTRTKKKTRANPLLKKNYKRMPKPSTSSQQQYTIQLYASRSPLDAKAYIQNRPNTNLRIARHNGWYTVTTGQYRQKQAAKRALLNLPQRLKQARPWVRTVSS